MRAQRAFKRPQKRGLQNSMCFHIWADMEDFRSQICHIWTKMAKTPYLERPGNQPTSLELAPPLALPRVGELQCPEGHTAQPSPLSACQHTNWKCEHGINCTLPRVHSVPDVTYTNSSKPPCPRPEMNICLVTLAHAFRHVGMSGSLVTSSDGRPRHCPRMHRLDACGRTPGSTEGTSPDPQISSRNNAVSRRRATFSSVKYVKHYK
jgi:hypothetical protein